MGFFFLITTAYRPALGPNRSPTNWLPGGVSLGIKRLGREADQSSTYSTEVKNAWSCASFHLYVFMLRYLAKPTDVFIFP